MVAADQLSATFDRTTRAVGGARRKIMQAVDAPADTIADLVDSYVVSKLLQLIRCTQAGQPGTDDNYFSGRQPGVRKYHRRQPRRSGANNRFRTRTRMAMSCAQNRVERRH